MKIIIILSCVVSLGIGQTMSVEQTDTTINSRVGRLLTMKGTLVAQERSLLSKFNVGGFFSSQYVITTEVVVAYNPIIPGLDTSSGIMVTVDPISNLYAQKRTAYIDNDEIPELINVLKSIRKLSTEWYKKSPNYRQLVYTTNDNLSVGFWLADQKAEPEYFIRVGYIYKVTTKFDLREFETFTSSIVRANKILTKE